MSEEKWDYCDRCRTFFISDGEAGAEHERMHRERPAVEAALADLCRPYFRRFTAFTKGIR